MQGGLLNQAQLAASLGVSASAVGRCVDLLVDLRLVRRLLPWCGNVGAGMVLEQLIVAAGVRWRPGFYRSQGGAEIDLLLESAGRPARAIKVKRSSDPAVPRGFLSACESLGLQQRYLVYSGQERFPLRHGVTAISIVELSALLAAGEMAPPLS
jgi:predicted AAA+ superfamily ATPase